MVFVWYPEHTSMKEYEMAKLHKCYAKFYYQVSKTHEKSSVQHKHFMILAKKLGHIVL